jgi:pantoate--beta-alanine ligase
MKAMTMPRTIRKTEHLRHEIAKVRRRSRTIGFVPTMGHLHDGHLALVSEARQCCDVVVVSIFVNPKQFGPAEDFSRYPRDLGKDRRILTKAGCDIIFAPSAREVYPAGFRTSVGVEGLRDKLCGPVRPGHFDGVCTVVLKLLLAVMPDVAFFGEKDYQQLVIVRRMVEDLALPIRIMGVPTVRDRDGLALSSRNLYLGPDERLVATSLYRSLELGKLLIASGERRAYVVRDLVTSLLVDSGVTRVEYVSVIDPDTLGEVSYIDSGVRLAVAAWIGTTRLIDNIQVEVRIAGKRRRSYRHDVVCALLAAGEGKRMRSNLPKILHTVGGRPMVEHVVQASRRAGIKDILAIIAPKSERVQSLMRRLRVETVIQDVQRGTGHAVLQAYPLLRDYDGNILVLSGDVPLVTPETIRRLLSAHQKHSNAITFATAVVPDGRGYGRIIRDKKGAFVKIVEERDADRNVQRIKEINGGIYCFKAAPLFDALFMLTADNAQMEYYLPDAVEKIRHRGGRVEALVIAEHREILGVNNRRELGLVRRIYSRGAKSGHN